MPEEAFPDEDICSRQIHWQSWREQDPHWTTMLLIYQSTLPAIHFHKTAMVSKFFLAGCLLVGLASSVSLRQDCDPGGNFDLRNWKLELNTNGNQAIEGDTLYGDGCNGYHDAYFDTDSTTGAMVMKVPQEDKGLCTPYSGKDNVGVSHHCRTELKEVGPSSWDWNASLNRLKVQMEVVTGKCSIGIGQIGPATCDQEACGFMLLYWRSNGTIDVSIHDEGHTYVGELSQPHDKFTYELRFENGKMTARINEESAVEISLSSSIKGDLGNVFFKFGNYLQCENHDSEVHVYDMSVQHS